MMYLLRVILILVLFNLTTLAMEIDSEAILIEKDPNNYNDLYANIEIIDTDSKEKDKLGLHISQKPKKHFALSSKEKDVTQYTKVSLIDVILETISKNNNVKAAREKVIQANMTLKSSYSGYKPTLDLAYKNSKNVKNPGDTGINSGSHEYNDHNIKVFIKQNLYAGGETKYKIKTLEKDLDLAKNKYELVISQEIQNAIKAYFGVVFAHQSVDVTKKNMEMLKKIISIVTTRYDLGAASIGDLSSIKANVANAQSKLNITSSKLIEALKYYEYIVGRDFRYTLPYEYNYDINVASEGELLQKADDKNLNILNYLRSLESQEYKLKGSKSSFRPQVDLEYTYTRSFKRDINPVYIQDTSEIFVTVNYNLYNGEKDSNEILSIYSAIRELQYKIAEERRKIAWIVSNSYQSLTALTGAIGNIIQEVESSQTMVDAYWETYKNAEQDLQTLLIGQRQLNTAEISLIQAYQDRLSHYFKILFETGELVAYFNLDPTKSNFIDFSTSAYKNKSINETPDDLSLTDLAKALKEKEETPKETPKEEPKEMQQEHISYNTIDDILVFKDKFLDANDNNSTIFISEFETIYNALDFIKESNLSKQIFIIETIQNYKLKNILAYGIYENAQLASSALNSLKQDTKKKYEIVPIQKIKELYKDSLIQFNDLKPKEIVKTKVIKMVPKPPKPYYTDKSFKKRFMDAPQDQYTINLVTFSKLDDVLSLINEEQINKEVFIFRYGNNAEWIKVLYGVFKTYKEAQIALTKLSKSTREKYYPIIENMKDKQELYKKYSDLELGVPSIQVGEIEYMDIEKSNEMKNEAKY